MTLSEFKAWFEGFTESMSGPPNKKQWERIQARVGEITGHAVTYPVYIDRYVSPLRPYWGTIGASNTALMGYAGSNSSVQAQANFNSDAAMNLVGKADALALAA